MIADSNWFMCPKPNPAAQVRLWCFPCAGGIASSYFDLARAAPDLIEVRLVELPGHGWRANEPPFQHLPDLIDALLTGLTARLQPPFAFLGHSMGAIVAFELAHALRRNRLPSPVHLFAAAHRAPHLPNPDATTHLLSDSAMIAKLSRLGGLPDEVLRERELLQLILPVLRADFTALDTYAYIAGPPLDCSITALGGASDNLVSRVHLEAWRKHTTADFAIRIFPGGHFFIHSARSMVIAVLFPRLEQISSPCLEARR